MKTLIVVSLCALSFATLVFGDAASDLIAEGKRHDAAVADFNVRCASYVKGSAKEAQCEAEYARLNAWGQSILDRVRALPARKQ